MHTQKVYDIIGIGIGPFNLGMAAMVEDIPQLECIFIDKNPTFHWHPGLLLPTAKMQVPFYADLVTLADPTSRFTYMNYLKATSQLFRFAINESYFPYRTEYNNYCQWVASQLSNLLFGHRCESVRYDPDKEIYEVRIKEVDREVIKVLHGKHMVLGVGLEPYVPPFAKEIRHPNVFHSGEYLHRKTAALMNRNITIIGSGQSAAEIFLDLLPQMNDLDTLHWYTRSARFYTMDYSKLALEMSSPDYVQYFFRLRPDQKETALTEQQYLYRGINYSLIDEIYQQLYLRSLDPHNRMPRLYTHCELTAVEQDAINSFNLRFDHKETGKCFVHQTDTMIMSTGYRYVIPGFVRELHNMIRWNGKGQYDVQENYSIDHNNSLFVQNADLYTHGFNSADLGLGPYRNAVILNAMLGYEHFAMEKSKGFQQFGPQHNLNPE